jgi:hypothetical protein
VTVSVGDVVSSAGGSVNGTAGDVFDGLGAGGGGDLRMSADDSKCRQRRVDVDVVVSRRLYVQ